jgi:hypothetical protein
MKPQGECQRKVAFLLLSFSYTKHENVVTGKCSKRLQYKLETLAKSVAPAFMEMFKYAQ